MPPDSSPPSSDRRRGPTFTEQARRAQLIAVTIDVIARHGHHQCSLQRIADAAGITKAAVLYHFAGKDAVIRAAYASVIAALTERVGAAVEAAATPAAAVEAYLRAMLDHMADHPAHVRVLVAALDERNDTGIEDRRSPARWQPLAALIDAAVTSGEYREDVDSRVLAIILGGAVDAVVAEGLDDPAFDLTTAATAVLTVADTARRR
jgi:AcrR family transcriptional regulator